MSKAIEQNCRWCETPNDITQPRDKGQPAYCLSCGHQIEGLPVDCDCLQCGRLKRLFQIRELEQASKQQ